jgi:hypothetical protein
MLTTRIARRRLALPIVATAALVAAAALPAGVQLGVLKPGRSPEAGTLRFPVSTGHVKADLSKGTIRHTGGLSFTEGQTVVEIRNLWIDLGKGWITGKVGDTRLAVFELLLDDVQPALTKKRVNVANVGLALTPAAAAALNGAFDADLDRFPAGAKIATAEVSTRIVGTTHK